MPKYYLKSGNMRHVLTACDAEGAAATALDHFLAPHSWVFGDDALSEQDKRAHLAIETLLALDATISVSQIGFGNTTDRMQFLTADLLDSHIRLATALHRFVEVFANCQCDQSTATKPRATSATPVLLYQS